MITDKDIQVVRLPEDPEHPHEPIIFEAHLRLSSRHMIDPFSIDSEQDPVRVKKMIEDSLRKRIMHHIYGDLRFPVNELLRIAAENPDGSMQQIITLRNQLKDVL